ncbi:MAG: cytochrome C oxidase subunit IV family protein [Ramlibacter sp.]|nr:cytochrome C oxidase subunit IV family protein [Ramlibacter sp.]
MNEQQERGGDAAARKLEERNEFKAYVWGISLALVLTLVPFALVLFAPGYGAALKGLPLLSVIGACALLQFVVHFRFFLHIGFQRHRADLQVILFSTLLLVIMVAGTVWIMTSLAVRMAMPASG